MVQKSLKAALVATFAIIAAANVAEARSNGGGGGGQGGATGSSADGPSNSGSGFEITHVVQRPTNTPPRQPVRQRGGQDLPKHCADAVLGFYACFR